MLAHARSFAAGFLATLIFHQGVIAILHAAGVLPFGAYDTAPTEPLGVPAVVSLSFWAGLWGVVLWLAVRRFRGARRWLLALAVGAVGPTAVALLVVLPLKGVGVSTGMIPVGLALNGVWGVGTLLLIVALQRAGMR